MLSPETLESYRQMTPAQRLELTLAMMNEGEPYLLVGTDDVVDRKFQRLNQENDKRNVAMLTQLSRSAKNRPHE